MGNVSSVIGGQLKKSIVVSAPSGEIPRAVRCGRYAMGHPTVFFVDGLEGRKVAYGGSEANFAPGYEERLSECHPVTNMVRDRWWYHLTQFSAQCVEGKWIITIGEEDGYDYFWLESRRGHSHNTHWHILLPVGVEVLLRGKTADHTEGCCNCTSNVLLRVPKTSTRLIFSQMYQGTILGFDLQKNEGEWGLRYMNSKEVIAMADWPGLWKQENENIFFSDYRLAPNGVKIRPLPVLLQ